jgi:hypothetical protein
MNPFGQRNEFSVVCMNMTIHDGMQNHHDRSKYQIHAYTDRKGYKKPGKKISPANIEACICKKCGHSFRKNYKRHIDGKPQETPHYGFGNDSKSFVNVAPPTDTLAYQFSQCCQDTEFVKTHEQTMVFIEGFIGMQQAVTQKERQEQDTEKEEKKDVGFFHAY